MTKTAIKLDLHRIFVIALHNMNRDEDGRPKSANVGGVQRGRLSSQAHKHAIRMFPDFPEGRRSMRTRELGVEAFDALAAAGAGSEQERVLLALAINFAVGSGGNAPTPEAAQKLCIEDKLKARRIADTAKKQGLSEGDARSLELRRDLRTEQGLVVSRREHEAARAIVEGLTKAHQNGQQAFAEALEKAVTRLVKDRLLDATAVDDDIALFGRMVAASPEFNVEAAVSVSHALTTHAFESEADYFSASEELNVMREKGAALTAYQYFGSGVYYQHLTIDLSYLSDTLGSAEAARRALTSLAKGVLFALPAGKRNAFAHMTLPSYILASRHSGPSFNLASAFLRPVPLDGTDLLRESVDRLKSFFSAAVSSYGLDVDQLAFVSSPDLRQGNAPGTHETWTAADFEAFVTAVVPEPRRSAA